MKKEGDDDVDVVVVMWKKMMFVKWMMEKWMGCG